MKTLPIKAAPFVGNSMEGSSHQTLEGNIWIFEDQICSVYISNSNQVF